MWPWGSCDISPFQGNLAYSSGKRGNVRWLDSLIFHKIINNGQGVICEREIWLCCVFIEMQSCTWSFFYGSSLGSSDVFLTHFRRRRRRRNRHAVRSQVAFLKRSNQHLILAPWRNGCSNWKVKNSTELWPDLRNRVTVIHNSRTTRITSPGSVFPTCLLAQQLSCGLRCAAQTATSLRPTAGTSQGFLLD